MKKKALVCHSGGMDSSICLRLASKRFGAEHVLSVGFDYDQRHEAEIAAAKKICHDWGIDRVVLEIRCLAKITSDALTRHDCPITSPEQGPPNTLVVGRNGLMARLCAIHAADLGADILYMGVMGLEGAHAGYRDCSRWYIDKVEEILRHDLARPSFTIATPLVACTKPQSLAIAHHLGVLDYLLEHTITCYEGLPREGCLRCPACQLRNAGLKEYASGRIKTPSIDELEELLGSSL